MTRIDRIMPIPIQEFFVVYGNDRIFFKMRYYTLTKGWTIDIKYRDIEIVGLAVIGMINILYQFKNILPFGLMVCSRNNIDPIFLNSFDNDCFINILDKTDMDNLEIIRTQYKDGSPQFQEQVEKYFNTASNFE